MTREDMPLEGDLRTKFARALQSVKASDSPEMLEWSYFVSATGRCYCQNPFHAHEAKSEEWVAFHSTCSTSWPWRGNEDNPTFKGPREY